MKKKHISKGVVVKPILSKDFNSRGQVDLMEFQSNPDGKYKFSAELFCNWTNLIPTDHLFDSLSLIQVVNIS
jgi:hypothetical protein